MSSTIDRVRAAKSIEELQEIDNKVNSAEYRYASSKFLKRYATALRAKRVELGEVDTK